MSEPSPFFNGVLSPPGSLKIGATLLSPDDTPSFLFSMRAPVIHTPAPPVSSTPLIQTPNTKKRQRDSVSVQQGPYRVVSGKNCRLQPYVVSLLVEVLSTGTADVLKYPLLPDLPHTEPESRRRMREHLRKRFLPVKEDKDLFGFTEKLLELWGGKLLCSYKSSIEGRSGKADLQSLVTPLRRPCESQSHGKFDDLEEGDLFQLDFLDEEVPFDEATGKGSTTMEDNWNCTRSNVRRVTYYETPSAISKMTSTTKAPVNATRQNDERAKVPNPKRGMRWTTAERKLFLQGLERWGAGNWKSIHKIIPGR